MQKLCKRYIQWNLLLFFGYWSFLQLLAPGFDKFLITFHMWASNVCWPLQMPKRAWRNITRAFQCYLWFNVHRRFSLHLWLLLSSLGDPLNWCFGISWMYKTESLNQSFDELWIIDNQQAINDQCLSSSDTELWAEMFLQIVGTITQAIGAES